MSTLEEIIRKSGQVMAKVEGLDITTNQQSHNQPIIERTVVTEDVLKNSKIPKSILESFKQNPIDTSIMDPRESSKIDMAINNITNDFDSDEKEMPTQEELINLRRKQLSEAKNAPKGNVNNTNTNQSIDYGYIEYLLNKVIDEKLSKYSLNESKQGLELKTFTMKDGTKYQGYVKKM